MRDYNFYYPIDSASYFNRAVSCLERCFGNQDSGYLFYAALELRSCIERLLFEYLVLIDSDPSQIDKYLKEYRVKGLAQAIITIEPEFIIKLEYTSFFLSTIGADLNLLIPDIDKLNRYYGILGSYLHCFKKPSESTQNQDWWSFLIKQIDEIREYLFKFLNVPRAYLNLNEKGKEFYQLYKDRTVPKEEIANKILEFCV